MTRSGHLGEFYEILSDLRERVGGTRMLSHCDGNSGWPERGVYFFFEDGELREDGITPRVARVGRHAVSNGSKATLWMRLRGHRGSQNGGGNHRGSIFRLRIGEALLQKESPVSELRKTWGHGGNAAREIRVAEAPLEFAVSRYIGQMPLLWVAVNDTPGPQSMRSYLEKNCIGLLSNFGRLPIDPPSANWLGRHSPVEHIRESGLWNSDYVDRDYDPAFLPIFREIVQAAIQKGAVCSVGVARSVAESLVHKKPQI